MSQLSAIPRFSRPTQLLLPGVTPWMEPTSQSKRDTTTADAPVHSTGLTRPRGPASAKSVTCQPSVNTFVSSMP
ncbi:hypothetical protein OHS59_01220 [Streptomyces sp. NBC_00414]|uniref:hypothetical protein n=1 Tax=Streptomyces sp. NBC_00414 TaxID=2975739 RepID=UPI002E1D6F9B